MAGKLTVFMVGTLAAVLRKKSPSDRFPSSVRILLPIAPQQLSKFDDYAVIPETAPFLGVPWAAIQSPNPHPTFRRRYRFPVMEGEGDPVDVAFFELDPGTLQIDFVSDALFTLIDGLIGEKPTKQTAPFLSWVADMKIYSKDNMYVDPSYMKESGLPKNVTVVDFAQGEFSVGRVGFEHQFRFINGPDTFPSDVAPTDRFDRTIADTLKLSVDLSDAEVTVTINDDNVLELDGENLSLVIGSEPLGHLAVIEPERPCGVPLVHHEILYQFSAVRPASPGDFVVPVCIDVPPGGKDPDLGRCVPAVFMTDPASAERFLLADAIETSTRPLSLHIGVNEFSSSYASSTSLPAPAVLDSCVRDAEAMRLFAHGLGFQSLKGDGKNVLADTAATVNGLTRALEAYGQVAGPGSFFLLTFSGHGMPTPFRGGGWCLNTNILLYSDLQKLLALHFSKASRVMVISDCCHAGRFDETAKGIKQVPMQYAAAFFSEEFVPPIFADESKLTTFGDEPSALPPIYFVFACGDDETISDGGKNDLSPFTRCVTTHPHDRSVPIFETNMKSCSGKASHVDRVPVDPTWETSEPFGMPGGTRFPSPRDVRTK